MTAEYKTKEYHREKAQQHYKKYKRSYRARYTRQRADGKRFVEETVKVTGCSKCSEKEPVALDLHHLHDKDLPVSQMYAYNRERLIEEINKCIVLCKNCHAKIHAGLITL
ncbi:MAG: hypothetical protein KGI25_08725 [Thaumarchaeota archaeon]|nr:hypothetical protein [Nitrososphaerota archaeon]